jgi:uncharacterized protein YggE
MERLMRISRLIGPAGALALGLAFAAAPALAADRTITVSGQGEARGVPDQAELSAGVATLAPTADAALGQNARKMTAVFDALKRIGVPERSIQTANFTVEPQYAPNPGGNDPGRINGYRVSNEVDVTLDDTKALGPALDALVGAGANQINSVGYAIRNPDALSTEARKAAMADALSRAQTYATAGGMQVGAVVTIQENGGGSIMPMNSMAMTRKMPPSTPTAAGEMSVTANVTVVYELK